MSEPRPLRFEDGALVVLDQTRLPAEEAWLRCTRPEEVADAIRRLAVRGAPAIGVAAAYGLALAAQGAAAEGAHGAATDASRGTAASAAPGTAGDAAQGAPADALRERVAAAAALLAATRPTAVNLRWALERARRAAERHGEAGPGAVAAALLDEAHAIAREQERAERAMAAHGATLFAPGDRVLTHCNTGPLATAGLGTAAGVIRAAWEDGRVAEVWVGETRPLLQGARLTAWELGRLGIPHRVVTDASVGALMGRGLVDRAIVGADRIAANGDVANKIGTYTAAIVARHHGVPFYVAAPLSSFDPDAPAGDAIPIEERDPAEVTAVAGTPVSPPGARAANWAFDVTPAELVSAIVTEAGVLEPPYRESIARAIDR